MSYQTIGGATADIGLVTTVDCQKQVRSWSLLRSLIELLIPTCNCTSPVPEDQETTLQNYYYHHHHHIKLPKPANLSTSSTTITGTMFGFRRGKLSFCIQTSPKSTTPILLLELAVPTTILAREMQGGVLRIALECGPNYNYISHNGQSNVPNKLLSMPLWTMYCNGKRVGYAIKRRPTKGDLDALRIMGSVDVGAGVISGKELEKDDEIMYLRANLERVSAGSSEAESFHLIDPDGSIGQELSIFFFRSRC